MTAIFLQGHFLIKLNGPGFLCRFVFVFDFFQFNYFSFLDMLIWRFIIFDARNIFLSRRYNFLGTGVPVGIELVPGLGLPPSLRGGRPFHKICEPKNSSILIQLQFFISFASGRMDFTRGNFKPQSASSILQALSCWFFGCNLLVFVFLAFRICLCFI